MFTVIIAEKKHFEEIRRAELFFRQFLEKVPKEIAFCEWNTEGQTLYESVPDLIRTVGRRREWRAIVIQEGSRTAYENPFDSVDFDRLFRCEQILSEARRYDSKAGEADGDESLFEGMNPERLPECKRIFSEVRTRKDELSAEEIMNLYKALCELILEEKKDVYKEVLAQPLQKLCTCFCYQPADNYLKKADEKRDVREYVKELLNDDSWTQGLEDVEHVRLLGEEKMRNELREECADNMLPQEYNYRTKGSMGIAQPSEIYCFALRTTENGFFHPAAAWESHTGLDYSDFTGRNLFFEKMRFLVFDMLPESHQNYRYDCIRFYYDLLLFAANTVPEGAMLPRKLYRMESENDEKELHVLISSFCRKLENTTAVIEGQIEKIKLSIPAELTDSEAKALFYARVTIPVSYSNDFKKEGLLADSVKPGLASDCPEPELPAWKEAYKVSVDSLDKLVKQPQRSLKKAVERIEMESEVDYNRIRVLNSFQMDDVRQYTEDEENKMVTAPIKDLFDVSQYRARLADENEKIEKEMQKRMSKKATIALGSVFIAIMVACLIPMAINNYGTYLTVPVDFIFGATLIGLFAAVLFAALLIIRLPLKKAMKDYNEAANGIISDVEGAFDDYSGYLSSVCNVRRGYKVLTYSEKNLDIYDRSIRTRKKHREDIEKQRAYILENYGDFADGFDMEYDESRTTPYKYDFGIDKREYNYDPPSIPEKEGRIEFLEKGNYVNVSTGFVKLLTIRMEELYDR